MMHCAIHPRFMVDSEYAYLLRRMNLFRDLSLKFADSVKLGKDPAVKILTRLVESISVKGLPPLDDLFSSLKKAAFDIHDLHDFGSRQYESNKEKTRDVPKLPKEKKADPKSLKTRWLERFREPDQTEIKLRQLSEELSQAIDEHAKCAACYREKRKLIVPYVNGKVELPDFVIEEIDDVHDDDVSSGDKSSAGKGKRYRLNVDDFCKAFREDKNGLEKISDDTYKAYNTERSFRKKKLQPLEENLFAIAHERVLSPIQDGVAALVQGCRIAGLSDDLLDELEAFDCEKIAGELVYLMSVKYHYPNLKKLQRNLIIPETYVELPDVKEDRKTLHYRGYRQWNLAGSNDNLFDSDYLCNFPQENIYVTALCKVKAQKRGNLALKKGMKIKQKFVSADGETAFGWTRSFKGGPKTYRFYSINATKCSS